VGALSLWLRLFCMVRWGGKCTLANEEYISGVPLMASAMVLHSLGKYNYVLKNTTMTRKNVSCIML
jgi:hypothetical protein